MTACHRPSRFTTRTVQPCRLAMRRATGSRLPRIDRFAFQARSVLGQNLGPEPRGRARPASREGPVAGSTRDLYVRTIVR